MGELVSAAYDKATEGIARIELRRAVEIKARLRRWTRAKPSTAVVANTGTGAGSAQAAW